MNILKFGTDGIRAVVNETLTPNNIYRLGCAFAYFVNENKGKKIIIGEDIRQSSPYLRCAFVSGLLANGIDVTFIGQVSTPMLSYVSGVSDCYASVMITASHNSKEYNGFKFFKGNGEKLSKEELHRIEILEEKVSDNYLVKADKVGTFEFDTSLNYKYYEYIKNKISFSGHKFVFDCANGVMNKVVKNVFEDAIIVCGNDETGKYVNENCGSTHTDNLLAIVQKSGYDYGFAFDGDGDRLITVTKEGKVLNGDDLLFLFAKHYKNLGLLKDNIVVGTILTNYGIEKALKGNEIDLVRVPVGDKFIFYEMKNNGYCLGGEESGHTILKDGLTGDGLLTMVEFLNLLTYYDKSASQMLMGINKYPTISKNVPTKGYNKEYILSDYNFNKFIEECEDNLGLKGRLVVRASGTENVIRVMVECLDKELAETILEAITSFINQLN